MRILINDGKQRLFIQKGDLKYIDLNEVINERAYRLYEKLSVNGICISPLDEQSFISIDNPDDIAYLMSISAIPDFYQVRNLSLQELEDLLYDLNDKYIALKDKGFQASTITESDKINKEMLRLKHYANSILAYLSHRQGHLAIPYPNIPVENGKQMISDSFIYTMKEAIDPAVVLVQRKDGGLIDEQSLTTNSQYLIWLGAFVNSFDIEKTIVTLSGDNKTLVVRLIPKNQLDNNRGQYLFEN